jgi:cell division protein FtsZ
MENEKGFEFDMPKGQSSIIKVIGVGGGGGNAVNHMYNQGIKGVDFIVCNTDRQALDASPVPVKIALGQKLTGGLGAGSIPEAGKQSAIENMEEIREILSQETKMVFITAGMGGGTGTGAAPIIAEIARELGVLTVGIVTIPFNFEGKTRRQQAENGIEELRKCVDTLLVINNERLREMFGNLTLGNAFSKADNVLAIAAKGIAEVISVTGIINVDFNDVSTVMKNSGYAVMGSATAEGENRAIEAVHNALSSPLLNDNDISGAKYVLLNITYGNKEVLMDEISDITDYIQGEAGSTAEVIWGHGFDESLEDSISITLIATGFHANHSPITGLEKAPERIVKKLEDKHEIVAPLKSPIEQKTENVLIENDAVTPFLKEVAVETPMDTFNSTPEEEANELNLTFDWEVSAEDENKLTEEPAKQELVKFMLEDENAPHNEEESQEQLSHQDFQKKAEERMNRVREYTSKLKKPDGIADLEKEPAFMRRNLQMEDTKHSNESNTSRFGLFQNEEGKTDLRTNNSFLHDNVD